MRLRDCKARSTDSGFDPVRSRPSDRLGGSPARPLAGSLPAALLLTSLGICAFGGCSSPIVAPRAVAETASEPTSTGSIGRLPTTFGDDLGEEDWRRAHAALAVALDPQGNGRPVRWDNPESGMRGAVNPTGLPYVAEDEICRDFLASIVSPSASRFVRGTGCKASGAGWALKRLRKARETTKAPGGNGGGADAARKEPTRKPGRA